MGVRPTSRTLKTLIPKVSRVPSENSRISILLDPASRVHGHRRYPERFLFSTISTVSSRTPGSLARTDTEAAGPGFRTGAGLEFGDVFVHTADHTRASGWTCRRGRMHDHQDARGNGGSDFIRLDGM